MFRFASCACAGLGGRAASQLQIHPDTRPSGDRPSPTTPRSATPQEQGAHAAQTGDSLCCQAS